MRQFAVIAVSVFRCALTSYDNLGRALTYISTRIIAYEVFVMKVKIHVFSKRKKTNMSMKTFTTF